MSNVGGYKRRGRRSCNDHFGVAKGVRDWGTFECKETV